jgi:sec-independent protein translocase protein TatB
VFGFSFSELVVVVLVALVVMGPKDLPKMLRRLGQWAGKIRRAAADLRVQSGIDDALRSEGLADDIAEIRKLARGELDAVRAAATVSIHDPPARTAHHETYGRGDDFYVVRDREYPRDGADAYGALPDNAIVYAGGLAKSPLHRDALYRVGDANAELPPDPVEADVSGAAATAEADVTAPAEQTRATETPNEARQNETEAR